MRWLAVLACSAVFADESELSYRKGPTRQATLQQTLRADGRPVLGPWFQVGPFDPVLRRPQAPEQHPNQEAPYRLYGGGETTWRLMPDYLDGYANRIDTQAMPASTLAKQPTVCLRRTIVASEATTLRVYLGCDTQFILWLNGKPVLYAGTHERLEPGQESVDLALLPGENVVVLKVRLSRDKVRFFLMPELGKAFGEALLDQLERDFPLERTRLRGYRRRAARDSLAAEDRYYRLVEIETPPGVVVEGGGLDFLPDGRLAVCTRRGYLYLVENPGSESSEEIRFQRFAEGLHEPLGLAVVDGRLVVLNKGELTRLRDTDGDGRADRFENLSNAWGLSGNYHEYAYGPAHDAEGNLYIALNVSFPKGGPASPVPYRGWVVRITPSGEFEPFCYGFRSPNGIGANAAGDVFVTDNQGEWVPACPLYHVLKDRFYGHPVSIRWTEKALAAGFVPDVHHRADTERTPPAVWFPYEEMAQSATDVVCDQTGGRFGPFEGQLFVGEMTKGLVARVQLEKVAGEYQGACFLFRRGCGAVNRMAFGPGGRMFLTRVNRGWGGGGLGSGLARLEFTGVVPLEVLSIHLLKDGFELQFTKPLAAGSGERARDYRLEQYRYENWDRYGSPRVDVESITVESVTLSPDRRTVRLRARGLKAGRVCRFDLAGMTSGDGEPLLHRRAFYTLNAFPN